MPYTPAAGDALAFDFTGGYGPPAGSALSFNFSDAATQNVLRLGLRWAVAAVDGRADLGISFAVEGEGAAFGALGISWGAAAPFVRTAILQPSWATLTGPQAAGVLGLSWSTEPAGRGDSFLGAAWRTLVGQAVARLGASWRTRAAVPGIARLGASWAVVGAPAMVAPLGFAWTTQGVPSQTSRLDAQWTAAGIRIDAPALDLAYSVAVAMTQTALLGFSWRERYYVASSVRMVWGDVLGASIEIAYDVGPQIVSGGCEIVSPIRNTVSAGCRIVSALGDVAAGCTLPLPIYTEASAGCELGSPIYAAAKAGCEVAYDVKTTDTVRAAVELVAPILGDAQVIAASPLVATVAGVSVRLQDVQINMDEGDRYWQCDVTLLDPGQHALFGPDVAFTVALGGETWAFVVESVQLERSGVADLRASVGGVSPVSRFAAPRAALVTKTWASAVLASDVVAELLPGASIDWRVIDWTIPAYRLAASNEAPIEIAQRVAAAAGAMIEANPDGTIYVRYAFPVPLVEWATASPDQDYSDLVDAFSVTESLAYAGTVNRLRIMDVLAGPYQDVIEFEQDRLDPASGGLRVYPSPWRTTFDLAHTSLPIVSIERIGVETAEHTEVVEVLRGQGSVQYPLHQLLSVEWLHADLGGITFDADSREFRSTSELLTESLARITYRTRFVDFRAVAYGGAQVQFVVREPDLV